MRNILILFVLLLILFTSLAEFVLPAVIARGVETALRNALGAGDTMRVRLEARPALRMLAGRFDRVTVEATNVRTAGLIIDRLTAVGSDVAVNLRDILAKKDVRATRGPSLSVTLRVSEANLKRYVLDNLKDIADPRVKIEKDRLVAGGYFAAGGKKFFLAVQGHFEVRAKTHLQLVIDQLKVDDHEFPVAVTSKLLEMLGPPDIFIDTAKFPMPFEPAAVTLEPGYLVVAGKTLAPR